MDDTELDGHVAEDEEPNLGTAKRPWNPSTIVFRPYSSMGDKRTGGTLPRPLRIIVNKPLVVRLTKDIIETYQICQPTFTYSESFNPKRYLTNPSIGVLNNGLDNLNSDYILAVNTVLVNSESNQRYIVKDLLGQGTFGQVVKCWSDEASSFVAVKVIKNQPAYYHQALVEISILTTLNQKFDPEDKHHIVRIHDHFVFHGHLCIAFEMLGVNLYELIRINQFRGISLNLLKLFAKQILDSLLVLRDASVIHCDLKPENILLTTSLQSAEIKLIDFGSACMENHTVYSYIQSRFYRSPEVLLGHPYTTAIDMWSFGCIAAELFLGLPLFPGASEYDLMKRMIERLGGQPPDQILRTAKNTSKYFKHVGSPRLDESRVGKEGQTAYHFLTESEYEAREMKKPASGKRYFNYVKLEDIIFNYPYRKKMTEEELAKENQTRLSFIDFLRGLVQFDPVKRWTPRQAAQHPFVTEEPFTRPYRPFPEIPRLPVCQGVTVDHNPGSGHWFGAGLSPQAVNMNVGIHYASPQHQPASFNHASSYGSLGSYGEGICLGSSIGSYGDANLYMSYCPLVHSALNSQARGVPGRNGIGESLETWQRIPQVPHGHALGVSPSNGMFRPLSLGLSPSQLTPPSSQIQLSPGSPIGSPGRYGPTSPARGGIHGTALGKAAAVGQYHKRMGLGIPGSLQLPSQENIMPHWQGYSQNYSSGNVDMGGSTYMDSNVWGGYLGSPRSAQGSSHLQPWRQRAATGIGTGSATCFDQKTLVPYGPGSKGALLSTSEMYSDGGGNSSPPDPGEWDPNFSDDLLFQEDDSDLFSPSSGASGGIPRPGQVSSSSMISGAGFGRPVHSYIQLQGTSNHSSFYRPNGLIEGYTSVEGSPPSVHGLQLGCTRAILKPSHQALYLPQQNSPSRLGQQSSPFFQQHLQCLYHPQQNPGQQLSSNAMGQHHKHHYYPSFNIFSVDQPSQSSTMPHSEFSIGEHEGNNSSYSMRFPQRDSRAEYAQFMASTRFPGIPGMNCFVPLGTAAPQLLRTGQKNDHPLSAVPTTAHGRQDYRKIG